MLFDDLPRDDARITPGVVHLPGWLELGQQAAVVSQLREIARGLAGTPLSMSRPQLKSGRMQVFMLHLGRMWVTEPTYRYVTHVAGNPVPQVPENLAEIARQALTSAGRYDATLSAWAGTFRPDMALVNYYPPGASMGMHQDRNENSLAPVVSLSIGDEALFRIGSTETRNQPWDEVTLISGDVIVFGGPKRLAFHGVPQTRPETLPDGCGLKEGRINITFRQLNGR